MGFRFQRRITLAPGIRLNLSKRGLGLSVGPRGASLSVGPSGVHGHAGIPGTGLAYRQKLNARGRSAGRGSSGAGCSSPAASLEALLAQGESLLIRLDIDGDGGIHYAHGDGTPMSDDEARVLRRHAGDFLREQLTQHCERLNVDLDWLGRLHEETPHPNITVYVTRDFTEMPAPPALRQPACSTGCGPLPGGVWLAVVGGYASHPVTDMLAALGASGSGQQDGAASCPATSVTACGK